LPWEIIEESKDNTKDKKRPSKAQMILNAMNNGDNDISELLIASDPKLASVYLLAEKAAKKAIEEFLLLLNNNRSDDELDRLLKLMLIEEMKERRKEKEELKKLLLPQLINSQLQIQYQNCVNQKVQNYLMSRILNNQPLNPNEYQLILTQAQQECQSQIGMAQALLPLLSSPSSQGNGNEKEGGEDDVEI